MENYKKNIIDALINGGVNNKILLKIDDGIQWAWNHWDEDIVSSYYIGEKSELPNAEFIKNYIENADFEADGYDVDYLKEIFA